MVFQATEVMNPERFVVDELWIPPKAAVFPISFFIHVVFDKTTTDIYSIALIANVGRNLAMIQGSYLLLQGNTIFVSGYNLTEDILKKAFVRFGECALKLRRTTFNLFSKEKKMNKNELFSILAQTIIYHENVHTHQELSFEWSQLSSESSYNQSVILERLVHLHLQ